MRKGFGPIEISALAVRPLLSASARTNGDPLGERVVAQTQLESTGGIPLSVLFARKKKDRP